mmetsp:Transcript_1381/g.3905  ORF Transcript_1381/g.3905 Transcript_1381/m.3905 type:complete len:191 (+) Transcript_1381:12-584(+)
MMLRASAVLATSGRLRSGSLLARSAWREAPALAAAARRALSTASKKQPDMTIPEGSAYAVLGVGRQVNAESLKAIYKSLAREWHPDRHQGPGREAAEQKFQEISEAYQTLSDPIKRAMYDDEIDKAKTAAEAAKAAKRFRAASWNTEVPDMRARLRNAKKEEPGMPPYIIAGTLAFVTGNFIMVVNWLGG